MARVVVRGDDVVVRLRWQEKLAARRREVRVPVSALRQVYVEPDWWRALRGEAGRGRWVPDRMCVGTRRVPDGEDFVAVGVHGPVLCVELRNAASFSRLAVSVRDPDVVMRELQPFLPRDRLG